MRLRGPVLTATDFSDAADVAIRQGMDIAGDLGTRLVACHVLPEAYRVRVLFPQEAGIDVLTQGELEARARDLLQARLAALSPDTMVEMGIEIESGTAHAGILAVAERIGAGLIVMGPGGTTTHVARSSGGPVLIARPSPSGGNVLGATDFSDPSLPAVQMATEEARRRGAKLRIVHCLDVDAAAYLPPALLPGMMNVAPAPPLLIEQMEAAARDQLEEALRSAGADGEAILQRRSAANGIVETAQAVATALVVVGTRGRTGLTRLALGSVAEEVVTRAPCSVLVVPLHPVS